MSLDTRSRLRDAIRTFNKFALNPVMLHLAGRKHFYASVIRHRGRVSGHLYATPVVAEHVSDDFVVPLPYGAEVDWLRNVMASGSATITSGGQRFAVEAPEIVDAAAAVPLLSPRRRKAFERVGIAHFAHFRAAADADGAPS